jgi:gliding motility-associated-like protein
LIAKNQYECYDTVTKRVKVHDEFTFYAPTAFTPNNDGINDVFYVIGNGINKNDFYLCVYDRFGNRVFETFTYDPENPSRMAVDGSFNGSVIKGDPVLTNGIYKWYCKFTDFLGRPHEESGTVNLIRIKFCIIKILFSRFA